MQAAVPSRPGHGRRRGLVPPLAATAVAAVLSTLAPASALAEPLPESGQESGHPRVTTVNRTQDLDPEGDTVTVSGIGHAPGSVVEVTTRAVPAEAAGTDAADEEAVSDTGNAVTVEVGARGAFSVSLATGAGFASEAGLDAAEDPFEIRLVEVGPAPDDDADSDSDSDSGDEARGGTWGADRGAGSREVAPTAARVFSDAPVSALSAPVVVGQVPVTFAAATAAPQTAPQTVPRPAPQAQPQTHPQTQPAAPQAPAPREPGNPQLTVSKTSGLVPAGETVTVTGTGYDTSKGVYVALCDTSSAGPSQAPSPCIGGVDMDGSGGASVWVSSNPPPYGEGLTTPYTGSGADGGFSVQLDVKASDENTDCTAPGTECAVVTRNDHTRSSDRGQDVFVPVSFGGDAGAGGGTGGGSDGGGDAAGGSGGGGGGDSTPARLPRTGDGLLGLVLAAVVAALTGTAALIATRRRRTSTTDPATG